MAQDQADCLPDDIALNESAQERAEINRILDERIAIAESGQAIWYTGDQVREMLGLKADDSQPSEEYIAWMKEQLAQAWEHRKDPNRQVFTMDEFKAKHNLSKAEQVKDG